MNKKSNLEDEKNKKTIFRVDKDKQNPYVIINKQVFEDPSISLKAKGVMGYLLSKPDNWIVRREDILKHCSDGATSLKRAIQELQESGYMKISAERGVNGEIAGWVTKVFETPNLLENQQPDNPEVDLRLLANPEVHYQHVDNTTCGESPPTNNNKLLNNDFNKKTNKKDFDLEFEEFWEAYPKSGKADKQECLKLYCEILKKDFSLHAVIVSALCKQNAERAIKSEMGVFHKNPKGSARWLRGRCWDDPIQTEEEIREEHKPNAPQFRSRPSKTEQGFNVLREFEQKCQEEARNAARSLGYSGIPEIGQYVEGSQDI